MTSTETSFHREEGGRLSLTVVSQMEGIEVDSGRVAVTVGAEMNDIPLGWEEHGEELLPGIPNEITLDQITPKLPGRAFHILSSVSRAWRKAIQSRLVYNARVRAKSTETLIVLNHNPSRDHSGIVKLALYSVTDKSCHKLPAIPHLLKGVPRSCQCISLDGKIYILGGYAEPDHASNEVYVLDLAGQREWKQCARMREQRQEFACGVIDGKIYVFGGTSDGEPACGSEVYDPKVNAWFPVQPMKFMRFRHHVMALGGELYIYGGLCFVADYFEKKASGAYALMQPYSNPTYRASFLDVYNPVKDEWRAIKKFGRHPADKVFLAEGKFHSMNPLGRLYIHDTDIEKCSWLGRQTFSLAAVQATRSHGLEIACRPLVVNDELMAMCRSEYDIRTGDSRIRLFKSKGFGAENKTMGWEQTNCLLCFDRMNTPFMCPIEL